MATTRAVDGHRTHAFAGIPAMLPSFPATTMIKRGDSMRDCHPELEFHLARTGAIHSFSSVGAFLRVPGWRVGTLPQSGSSVCPSSGHNAGRRRQSPARRALPGAADFSSSVIRFS
jgi:hypothetical protein